MTEDNDEIVDSGLQWAKEDLKHVLQDLFDEQISNDLFRVIDNYVEAKLNAARPIGNPLISQGFTTNIAEAQQ